MYSVRYHIGSARVACGYTLSRLAKLTGLSKELLSCFEAGDLDPSIPQLLRIADVLEVDVASLVSVFTSGGSLIQNWWL